MATLPNEVLDQWDLIEDAAELWAAMEDGFNVASDAGAQLDGNNVAVHVVPCIPGAQIVAGARISGMKVARVDGRVGIYLFVEGQV